MIEKEDVTLLAQLLYTMKEVVARMEKYYKKKDVEKLNSAKKELLELQKRINEVI